MAESCGKAPSELRLVPENNLREYFDTIRATFATPVYAKMAEAKLQELIDNSDYSVVVCKAEDYFEYCKDYYKDHFRKDVKSNEDCFPL